MANQSLCHKTLSMLIFAILLISMVFVIAGGSDGSAATTEGQCGKSIYWSIDSGGNLTIAGKGDMFDYAFEDVKWGGNPIASVSISDGVTSIGKFAFMNCPLLESVVLPDSVVRIGSYAFGFCTSMKTISLSSSLTDIGIGAFQNCSFRSIVIPDSVKSIGTHAFLDCSQLREIIIEGDGHITFGQQVFYKNEYSWGDNTEKQTITVVSSSHIYIPSHAKGKTVDIEYKDLSSNDRDEHKTMIKYLVWVAIITIVTGGMAITVYLTLVRKS